MSTNTNGIKETNPINPPIQIIIHTYSPFSTLNMEKILVGSIDIGFPNSILIHAIPESILKRSHIIYLIIVIVTFILIMV
ncbi:hypothetical protein [Flavobacterium hydatis]|uniref:hypothetical protein n=1 Tax=Flavobacterium hydatis TaxID=991 RepID=UPI000F507D7C|nr:hypothetical protein [Flavobacterium hydatis]